MPKKQFIWVDDPFDNKTITGPFEISVNNNTPLVGILKELLKLIDKEQKFPCGFGLETKTQIFPTGFSPIAREDIIDKRGKVRWNVDWTELTIGDIKRNFNNPNRLYFYRGIYGVKSGFLLWPEFIETIKQIANDSAALIAMVLAIEKVINIVKPKLEKENATPQGFTKFILNKKEWNLKELSSALGLKKEQVQDLLKGFGYKYNRKKGIYILEDEDSLGKRLSSLITLK